MKRRALILVLILVLLVGMFPMTASAASDFTTSDKGVDLIKHFEGFRKYPYWDYSQWTVGYGTRCPDDKLEEYKARGITEAEAEALLQKELKSFESTLNKFIDKYDLKWNQKQFDAMLSFTYNVGGNWTNGVSTQLLTQYVVAGKTGNDFLFAFAQWSNAGGSMSIGLVERRLIEANLFLNGVYATKVPENYDYVKFSHTDSIYEGKVRSIKLQAYDSNLTDSVRPEGKKDGYRFLGWYTASTGGEWIETLTAKHADKTLDPPWQSGNGDPSQGTEASYTRTASGSVKIYAEPSLDATVTGSIAKGTVMNFVADYVDADGVKWGRLKEGGWVCLSNVAAEEPEDTKPSEPTNPTEPPVEEEEEKVIATGKIKLSSGTLNIRSGPGSSYSKVGSLSNGAKVEIYEIKNGWGRISKGWISMDYVVLDEVEEEPKPETVIAKGLVAMSSGDLNIRKGAGTSYAKVGSIANGSKVELYEIVTVDGVQWGRVSGGWISLKYVKLAETGTVTADSINVRKGAGTSYDVVGSYKKGDKIYVYETTLVGSSTWGHTDKGWMNMKYAKMDNASTDGGNDTPETNKGVTGVITRDTLNIRAGAGTSYALVGTYVKGDKVTVYETKELTTSTWGRTDKGWINMQYVKLDGDTESDSGNDTPAVPEKGETGYVTRSTLNARKGAGTSYAVTVVYEKDDVVTVYETTKVGTSTWGRTDNGWVNMAYIQMDADVKPITGTVTATSLTIRAGAGTEYDSLGSYVKGDKVSVVQTVTVGSSTWGRTNKGWINMKYVQTGNENQNESQTPTAAVRTGTVTASGTLNVRKGAGSGYAKVGSVSSGDKLTITDLKLVDGSAWGKISSGWVCLDYVKLDKPASGAPALIMGDNLNVRKGAGTGYSVVAKYDKGTVVKILETKTVSGTTWGRTDKGWVSMDYVL